MVKLAATGALLCLIAPGPAHAGNEAANALAVTHVTVIDATGSAPAPDMTVLIAGARIVDVGTADEVRIPAGAFEIDGTGKFLIPGLWDMHTHVVETAPLYFPVLVANGVTGIRNMHARSLQEVNDVKARVESGALPGPRMVASGPLVDGPAAVWPSAIRVATPDEGREAVDALVAEGADFIKVYSFLARDVYFAITGEAIRSGVPFVGHVPESVTVREAAEAGQKSIEHLDGILRACSRQEARLNERYREAGALWRQPRTAAVGRARSMQVYAQTLATYDAEKCRDVLATLRENGTWQTPTLVTHYTNAHRGEDFIRDNPDFEYVPASQRERWRRLSPPPPDWVDSVRALFARRLALVGEMAAAGVPLLSGTDVGGALLVPGFSLHTELELLVDAGLSPMAALQTATRNPARYLGKADEIGTVEEGKAADLVLLDADPLADIANTRRIAGVILRGDYLSRAELDELLAIAESKADASS